MMDLWKTILVGTFGVLLVLFVRFWARSSPSSREELCEVRLLAGEGGNENLEEEKERCFHDGYAQGVQDAKAELEAKFRAKFENELADANACHAREVKKLRAKVDDLSARLRTADIRIKQQSGLISANWQKIAGLRAEIARRDQNYRDEEALGEQLPIVAQEEEKIQQLTVELQDLQGQHQALQGQHQALQDQHQALQGQHQALQGQHQATIDYAEHHYREKWQEVQQAMQKLDQLQRGLDKAVQERDQILQEYNRVVQELSKAKQELDQALQQVVNDRQDDQTALENKCAQLQQGWDKAIRDRDDTMQKCREALQQKDHELKRVQQAREDGEALRDSDYSKLQQKLDQAIEAKDQAVEERHLIEQKMTEVLQERDEVLQKKDRDLQKCLEALQQEHQGRMEDRADWNSQQTELVKEKDWLVQELDRVVQESQEALQEKDRSMQQLEKRHQEDEARWNSANVQLQQERDDLAAELSSRQNASEEDDDVDPIFVRDVHEDCRERIAELTSRNAALNELNERAANSERFVKKTLADIQELRKENKALTERVKFFQETCEKNGTAASHSYCEERFAELESGKKEALAKASEHFAGLIQAQEERQRLRSRLNRLENPNPRSGLRGVRAETDRIHRRSTAATNTKTKANANAKGDGKAKANTGMIEAMFKSMNIVA